MAAVLHLQANNEVQHNTSKGLLMTEATLQAGWSQLLTASA